MKQSTLKRFLHLDRFEEHLELHRLDCASSHRRLDNYEYVKERFETLSREALKPPLLVTGHDLIAMGYTPGPAFRRVLDALEDAQLEGSVTRREEALDFARRFLDGMR